MSVCMHNAYACVHVWWRNVCTHTHTHARTHYCISSPRDQRTDQLRWPKLIFRALSQLDAMCNAEYTKETSILQHQLLLLSNGYWPTMRFVVKRLLGFQRVASLARWLSPKYWTLAVPVSVAQTIELFTNTLFGPVLLTFIYRTGQRTNIHCNYQPGQIPDTWHTYTWILLIMSLLVIIPER